MPLRLVKIRPHYGEYLDTRTGALVNLGANMVRVVPFYRLDLQDVWETVQEQDDCTWRNRTTLLEDACRALVTDPRSVDITFCDDCDDPARDTSETVEGSNVCEDCTSGLTYCEDCERYTSYPEYIGMSGAYVCSDCCSDNYRYCDDCGSHYPDGETCCSSSCDCQARGQVFTARGVQSDAIVPVTLPPVVSDAGARAVSDILRTYATTLDDSDTLTRSRLVDASYALHWDVARDWTDAAGRTYPRRLATWLHASYGVNLPADVKGKVGDAARVASAPVDVRASLTRREGSAADFAHDGSCWWQSYAQSRCTLKALGGMGLRTWSATGRVEARWWVQPLDADGQPTRDTDAPSYVVYNSAPNGPGAATGARILADMLGLADVQSVEWSHYPDHAIYLNRATAYVVGAPVDGGQVDVSDWENAC